MDDQATVRLLTEIRDLLQRSVGNQEKVLRASDESMQMYRSAARRQVIGLAIALFLIFVFMFLLTKR